MLDNYYYEEKQAIPLKGGSGKDKKKAILPYKTDEDKQNLLPLDSIIHYGSIAYMFKKESVLFDGDGQETGNKLRKLIEHENIPCRLSESLGDHGGYHVTCNQNPEFPITKSNSKQFLAIGLQVDIKGGFCNSYEIVKLNGNEYPVLRNELGIAPDYFKILPKKDGIDFTTIEAGERTNALNRHMFALVRNGFTPERTFEIIRLINSVILSEPVEEIESTVLNDSTYQKLQEIYGNTVNKKEVTPESFEEFLNEKGISIRYNKLTKVTEFENLPSEYCGADDEANAIPILMLYDMKKYTGIKNISKQTILDLIFLVADKNSYNPVHDYFCFNEWDQVDRFGKVFEILNVNNVFEQVLIKKWFVQCVALSFNTLANPIQAEGVLILSGKEGIGKTRFFTLMTPNPYWFRSKANMLRLDNKDNLISVLGAWIVELGEIDATLSNKRADLKSFITASTDNIRKPYAREESTTPRTTSFCGTTNKEEFLNEETGYRRWWNVKIDFINQKKLKEFTSGEDIKQFWMQCYTLWKEDEDYFRLSFEEKNQLEQCNKEIMEMLPAEDELRLRFDFEAPIERWNWVQSSVLKNLPEYDVCDYKAATIGKALNKIMGDYPQIKKKMLNGCSKYLIPPAKRNTDMYRNISGEGGGVVE